MQVIWRGIDPDNWALQYEGELAFVTHLEKRRQPAVIARLPAFGDNFRADARGIAERDSQRKKGVRVHLLPIINDGIAPQIAKIAPRPHADALFVQLGINLIEGWREIVRASCRERVCQYV